MNFSQSAILAGKCAELFPLYMASGLICGIVYSHVDFIVQVGNQEGPLAPARFVDERLSILISSRLQPSAVP